MLSTRSARLAAILLLALLFGWQVRGCRNGTTQALPTATPASSTSQEEAPKTTFPVE